MSFRLAFSSHYWSKEAEFDQILSGRYFYPLHRRHHLVSSTFHLSHQFVERAQSSPRGQRRPVIGRLPGETTERARNYKDS